MVVRIYIYICVWMCVFNIYSIMYKYIRVRCVREIWKQASLERLAPASPASNMCCCSHRFFAATSGSLPGLLAAKTDRGGLSSEAAPGPINKNWRARLQVQKKNSWLLTFRAQAFFVIGSVQRVYVCMSVCPPAATREKIGGCI